MISNTTPVSGAGKGVDGWFTLTHACVGYDHAITAEHAFLLDFMNQDMGPAARVGVELDLASARALVVELQAAIEAAEANGVSG